MIVPRRDVGLVLLALLDRGVVPVEVLERRVPLHPLRLEVPVGHRVPNGHDALAGFLQDLGDRPRRLGLARTRADGTDGDHGDSRLQHRRSRPQQHEVRAGGHDLAGLVHHVRVGDVRVAEDDVVDLLLLDQRSEHALVVNLDAVWVALTGQARRVHPVVDERDLGRGEGDDLDPGIVPIGDVEVVEVAPCGAHDEQSTLHPWILSEV